MSDTDKDKPWWVTAEWWKPEHWNCDRSMHRRWGMHGPRRECDLPAAPVVEPPRRYSWRGRHLTRCVWYPDNQRHAFAPVPRWFVHHVWTNVERVSVRDDCRRAAAEYRATGQVDTEPSVRQHRHGATWYWE